jgi:hypothetical protein
MCVSDFIYKYIYICVGLFVMANVYCIYTHTHAHSLAYPHSRSYVNWDNDIHPQCYVHCSREMFAMTDHIHAAAKDSGLGFKFPISMVRECVHV